MPWAVPLTLAGLCHSRDPLGENQPCTGAGSREQRTGRGQAEALPWPRRKRQAGRAAERAARVVAGGGEQGQHGGGFLWAEEFSARQAQGEQLARERHREE